MNAAYLFDEVVAEQNEKDDHAQDLDGERLGVQKEAVAIERLRVEFNIELLRDTAVKL